MLSKNLAVLRDIHGLSQEEAAEIVGISRQAYAKWEKGETVPDVEKCALLAEYYGTTVDSLLNFRTEQEGMTIAPAPKGKHIWGTVIVSERGQIVIPKAARELFGIKSGDRLVVLGDDAQGIALMRAEDFERSMNEMLAAAGKKCE